MTSIIVETRTFFNDRLTPIQGYLNIRDFSSHTFLCESAEYLGSEGRFSIIGAVPLAESISNDSIEDFFSRFSFSETHPQNGFYGTINYPNQGMVHHELYVFAYVIIFNHHDHTLTFIHNRKAEESKTDSDANRELFLKKLLHASFEKISAPLAPFSLQGAETADMSDEDFKKVVEKLQWHIQRGDIFQVVPSRRFQQRYEGDCFQVYRSLRIINPSPYLFYFQFGDHSVFGSSPEAALLISNREATLNPIAGTTPRSGEATIDSVNVEKLLADQKEASEHVMLVDLARNDLSRHCYPVLVKRLREVHHYSHVIHLVSAVTGTMLEDATPAEIFYDTLPAGTVSGAPKVRAMELIAEHERSPRDFYAGTVGFFGANGDTVQALTIRTFFAQNNILTYRAGAGVVIDSVPEKELLEVQAKLKALRTALVKATTIHEIDLTY